jgi:hypothetical protein
MGANTYIGNAPNLMVKAIAEDRGVKMPSFFGYMAVVVRHPGAAVHRHDLHLVSLTHCRFPLHTYAPNPPSLQGSHPGGPRHLP